jgi:hypothetical protein
LVTSSPRGKAEIGDPNATFVNPHHMDGFFQRPAMAKFQQLAKEMGVHQNLTEGGGTDVLKDKMQLIANFPMVIHVLASPIVAFGKLDG